MAEKDPANYRKIINKHIFPRYHTRCEFYNIYGRVIDAPH